MLKNYFKIAWRNLLKSKVYSLTNIVGLATGMAVALLIGLWIWDEVSFDSYHSNHGKLAQVMNTIHNTGQDPFTTAAVSAPQGPELRDKYGDNFRYLALTTWNADHILAVGEKKNIFRGNVGGISVSGYVQFKHAERKADCVERSFLHAALGILGQVAVRRCRSTG